MGILSKFLMIVGYFLRRHKLRSEIRLVVTLDKSQL